MGEVLILSGSSGAGKHKCAEFLEDIGYFSMENLPFSLLSSLPETVTAAKSAIVCDIRGGREFAPVLRLREELRRAGHECRLLFLSCNENAIIRRYKESRRIHPLCASDGLSLREAIEAERQALEPLSKSADLTLDTSGFSTSGQLRSALLELLGMSESAGMEVSVLSFGFKYGVPLEADLLMDVRFLPNPYYIPELRPLTGLDQPILDYLSQFKEMEEFLKLYRKNLSFLLPLYAKEGKRTLTIGVGCTGGQHRSVALCHAIAAQVAALGYPVREHHRDLLRNRK